VRAAAAALALEQRGGDLCDGTKRRAEVGDLNGGHRRRGVVQQAGPALVVEVVPGREVVRAEAGEGAVDDRLGHVPGTDPEPVDDSRAEALEDDVRVGAEGVPSFRVGLEVDLDRLLARVEGLVPGGRELLHRVAAGRQEPRDAGSQAHQLPARERAGQVARQVNYGNARERLHQAKLLD
jgi:hypothetical protein